ncbi:MAG: DUF2062 domain-containing protein [Deltaproteobacteria bacterium]|nr:DUF2062 domain-containing protein [Deltaproteobacteria bacterium]
MPNGRPYSNKRHPVERVRRWLKLWYYRILRIDDPPERIARGAAIGVLMGVLPTFGVGGFLAVGLAFLLKANKAAAVLGSFIVNPLTSPFFWTLSAVVGSFIMGEDSSTVMARIKHEGVLASTGWVGLVYMTGNVILSAVFTALSYYIVKAAVIRHRRKKEEKRLRRQNGGG